MSEAVAGRVVFTSSLHQCNARAVAAQNLCKHSFLSGAIHCCLPWLQHTVMEQLVTWSSDDHIYALTHRLCPNCRDALQAGLGQKRKADEVTKPSATGKRRYLDALDDASESNSDSDGDG